MKRYRILGWDFDSTAMILKEEIRDEWEADVKEMHRQNKQRVENWLLQQYGAQDYELKKQNFIDLGPKSFSVITFHNQFYEQIRTAFVMGAYYPALTGTCALGERILNHLILSLREDFKHTSQYKKVYDKSSFDDWMLAISTLESWGILLPQAAREFKTLMEKRNKALHFSPQIDQNPRQLALEAVDCLKKIIAEQFPGLGSQPWFMGGIPGEVYIKKEWEPNPFVRTVYLPNGILVGPKNQIESIDYPRFYINDNYSYDDKEISDEEFVSLRLQNKNGG